MTIEKLQRVLWRLRKLHPDKGTNPTNHELKIAIMMECGTDPTTYRNNRKALKTLDWIRSYGNRRIRLTNKDMTD